MPAVTPKNIASNLLAMPPPGLVGGTCRIAVYTDRESHRQKENKVFFKS